MAQPITFSDDKAFDNILVLQAHEGELLTVPGESWLLKADFKPQGHDLLLTSSDGSQVLIKDYFNLNNPPDLVTDSGGLIPAELAVQLAGPSSPGQFALLETGPFAQLAQASESIGRVEAIDGLVEAIRVDGTTITLAEGDDIFQGDTVVTGKGAAIGITFVDDTIFSLGEDGRMVIDEMVYDPASQEGTFNANLVQGVFTFVSGEIAKTGVDAMTVTTPVATIGIRGTKVAGRAAQEGADNTISLLPETLPDGTQVVGQLAVSNQSGGPPVVLSSPGATMQVKSAFSTLPPPVVFSPEQIQQNFGSTLTMQASTEVAKATNDASKNAAEAEEAKAEADQAAKEAEEAEAIAETAEEEAKVAEAEAEAAATEAEVAAIEAEALAAEAEAVGDAELIAEAEAKSAEAEALAVEAAAKAEEAEAQIAEAEAQIAEAEAQEAKAIAAKAEAEAKAVEAAETDAIAIRASQNLQIQNEAFAQFGGPVPPGTEDDSPPDGEVPPDGEAPPDGGPQGEGGPRPTEGEPPAGEGRLDETGEAPAEGPLDEEAEALAEATAIEEGAVGPEGDIPQDIALTPEGATDQFDGDLGGQPPPIDGTFGDQEGSFAGENPEGDIDAFGGEITPLGEDGPPAGDIAAFGADGPGLNDDAPGFGGDAPGFDGDAPGFGGDAPGFGGDAPGFGGDAPGFGGDSPSFASGGTLSPFGGSSIFGSGGNMYGGEGNMFGGGGDMYGGGGDAFGSGVVMYGGGGDDIFGGGGDIFGGGGDIFGGSGDSFGEGGDFFGGGDGKFAAFDPLAGQRFDEVVQYYYDYYFDNTSEEVSATVDYETLSLTAGSGGSTYNWTTNLSNNGTTISASSIGKNQFLSGTITDTRLTGADDTIGVFEFTGASLGSNDIIVGETSDTTIEEWAASALSTVDHYDGDNLVFIMYDDGSVTSTAAILEFTGDSTTTGITSSELDLIAVADVAQDSITFDNIV